MNQKTKEEIPVLIIGGGLAGLSAAYHLKNTPHLVLERENQLGGTSRSFSAKGFTFDITGHLLHLHDPYTKKLIPKLLRTNAHERTRNAWIFSENRYTRYPFQANTFGLPEKTRDQCVLGFLEPYFLKRKKEGDPQNTSFKDWCHGVFGKGIADHFLIPYNEKLFQTKADRMTADWCGPFVPKPTLEDIIRGSMESQEKRFGYNPSFLYPKKGGIQSLVDAFAKKLKTVRTGLPLARCDWENKTVVLKTGQRMGYKTLINTMPLRNFVRLLDSPPASVRNAAKKLKTAGILCLNVGVNRPRISDKSWIYFPEKQFPFYRVGFYMNFSSSMAPPGHSSMYIEIPLAKYRNKPKREILKEVKKGLIQAQILKGKDKILAAQFLPMPHAYVIYDRQRSLALKTIFSFLKKHHIVSIGRYGSWVYSFMEEAILNGKRTAERIRRKGTKR